MHRIRYEQEGKLAKTLESEKLLKEAEEARLALMARKEKAMEEARYDCNPWQTRRGACCVEFSFFSCTYKRIFKHSTILCI